MLQKLISQYLEIKLKRDKERLFQSIIEYCSTIVY